MSQDPRVKDDRKFIETCLELKLISEKDAGALNQVVGESSGITQTVLRRGLLTAADVDIVQSLQYPTEVVPGYRIRELIGRGAMGVVYRAEQIDLEKTVALKTILISKVHDPTVAARFEREAKSLAQLQHPSIVQALNFGKHEGRYFFAMEFVAGRTCDQSIREAGRMPAEKAWSIVRQTSSGLMHALGHNLIHRDIKPANLILLPPPEGSVSGAEIVKIADFGLAMFTDPGADEMKLTTGDKVMGSPAYMSLEQFGGRQVDFRSDMYSLGATAWHLLFGAPPFQGSSVGAVFQQKLQPVAIDSANLPVALPEDQVALLKRLLDPDPNLRPQSYMELIQAIDALDVSTLETTLAARSGLVSGGDLGGASSGLPLSSPARSSPTIPDGEPTVVLSGSDLGSAPAMSAGPSTMGNATEQTVAIPGSSIAGKSNRKRWIMATCVLAVLAVLIGWMSGWMSVGAKPSGPRIYTRVVGNTPLFDGVTLTGWDVGGSMVGAWNSVEAPDSSTAIACTTQRGALTRQVPETSHPRISLFVWLQPGSGPVDVDFAFNRDKPTDTRGCLRMSGEKNHFGTKTSDFGALDIKRESDALASVHDRYHVIHIERQPTDWYVFLEEQLVGTLPIATVGSSDAIRLVVHGDEGSESKESQAFFADVQLYEMQQRDSAR